MRFEVKKNGKEESSYKTIYIREHLLKQIENIAAEQETSVNRVIISMIEACLNCVICSM